uniref:Reverse transcriptase domain-containing protein n=1 Tax=Tanacetum cinerariifolium TaxID=118510 RepID=A0A699H9D6_TANCI|nr:hypothetical protein [Tanacetum cinerariifolium]
MAPKRRSTKTTTTTTHITDAQLKALIARGVADALAEQDADRSKNSDDSHKTVTGVRRQAHVARECTYIDFFKCQPLNFKGTEGVVGLIPGIDVRKDFPEESDMIENTLVERQAENKRKLDNINQAQQQPHKKQGVAISYTVGPGERKEYAETLPLCNKCKFHHNGQCTVKHYMSDCSELKNQNHGNQARGSRERGMMYALEGGENNQDLNNMKMILMPRLYFL